MNLNLSKEYDHKALTKYLIISAVMIAALKLTGGFAAILFPFFVIGSLTSKNTAERLVRI